MADLLFCSRIHEDGRCNHPVTGERHGEVVAAERRSTCTECGHAIRRDPADHPELRAACVDHIDDDEWVERHLSAPQHSDGIAPVKGITATDTP